MGFRFRSRITHQSLSQQIRAAERDLSHRQRRITVSTGHLVHSLHQQLTAPTSLLMASVVGFIIGELTRRQTPRPCSAGDQLPAIDATRWQTALRFAGSVHALYTALPVAWLVRLYRQARSTNHGTEQRFRSDARRPVHHHRANRREAGHR